MFVFREIVFDRFSHLSSASSWLFVLVADWFEIHPIDTNILYRRCTELCSDRKAADLLQWHFIDFSLHFWHNLHKSMWISNSFRTLLIIFNSGRLLQHTKHFHNLTLHLICYFNCCHLSAKKRREKQKIKQCWHEILSNENSNERKIPRKTSQDNEKLSIAVGSLIQG